MIWTAVQIGLAQSFGSINDSIANASVLGAWYLASALIPNNPLHKVGYALHTPERIMFNVFEQILEETTEVVDEVNETALNLLDTVYTGIYGEQEDSKASL